MNVIGRLRPGVTLAQAQAEMEAITARVAEQEPLYKIVNFSHRVIPLHAELTKDIDTIVWVLTGAVALILLIACANVANLLLVRATSRRRDMAILAALGCSRRRLFQFVLVEAALLAVAGGVLGVALAGLLLPVLIAMQPQNLPQLSTIGIDYRIMGYAFAVVTVVTLLAGCVPAAVSARRDVAGQLKDRSAHQESRGSGRWRNGLVIGEVALSFALLVGAGLMIRSFIDLNSRDPGFNPAGVVTFGYNLPNERYPEPAQQLAFHREFEQRLAALPGVVRTGGVFPLPLSGLGFGSRYATDLVTFEDGSARQAAYHITYPGFFEAIGAKLTAGRTLTQPDQDGARNAVVVNQALAERAWPGKSPIGETLYIRRGDRAEPAPTEVIGVIQHVSLATLDEEPAEALYFPSAFSDATGFGNGFAWTVRTAGDPRALLGPIQDALRRMDPELPLQNEKTLADIVRDSTAPMRFSMTLTSIFGALALLLAVVGLYGVLAYRVRQRRPELGVRLTFGAAPRGIFALVVRQGMLLVAIGLGIGLAAALALSRTMTQLLVGIGAADPLTYAGIIVLFALVALLACALPAWRATRVDPAVTLRYE
jgi:putative ABC transport system permease protein